MTLNNYGVSAVTGFKGAEHAVLVRVELEFCQGCLHLVTMHGTIAAVGFRCHMGPHASLYTCCVLVMQVWHQQPAAFRFL